MKFLATCIALAAGANAHAIFQQLMVAGNLQPKLMGIRAPDDTSPLTDVTDGDFGCNRKTNLKYLSEDLVTVTAGDNMGTFWQHTINGPLGSNDADNPIAGSHKGALFKDIYTDLSTKGPISVYLAKVDDAVNADPYNLDWFKIAHDGLDTQTGVWAVDKLIYNGGWHYFQMPSCVPAGQYLMRVELLALHEANHEGGAQFYMECAHVLNPNGGSTSGAKFVKFPGAYNAKHRGILVEKAYGSSGQLDNSGMAYEIPGPAPLTCSE
ncbi:endoglucanase II (glycosyl hydrolase family 61) [Colletotrichum musicola]|uniref:lytic cellulose monooxygenase (C4-dehydrogenating) n=1 Tax=Colletotrichum musicola TaxID=2175873 RepID=A0A8H6NUB8_9PEZI|nr:endoglucanase II (glycosyl hydrolase family 61) [Colletotrichum musicola]